ncbi:MAG: hypothetical protein H7A32_01845 [Deltaproteobacteria bacterium]|nr:hypothetical protein [Deltaproteobacteria bacterium]
MDRKKIKLEKTFGKPIQNLYNKLLKLKKSPEQVDVVNYLCRDLEKQGVTYHPRTIKRQLLGNIEYVPIILEESMLNYIRDTSLPGAAALIKAFKQEKKHSNSKLGQKASKKVFRENENNKIAKSVFSSQNDDSELKQYVDAQVVIDAAKKIFDQYPQLTKRQLALLIKESSHNLGFEFSLNTLQYILAGKTNKSRRVLLIVLNSFLEDVEAFQAKIDVQLQQNRQGRPSLYQKLQEAYHDWEDEEKTSPNHENHDRKDEYLRLREDFIKRRYTKSYGKKSWSKSTGGRVRSSDRSMGLQEASIENGDNDFEDVNNLNIKGYALDLNKLVS